MKPILALNAFDMNATADFGGALGARIKQRAELFGAASVLFYERPLEIVRGEGCWLYDADGVAYLDAYNNVPSVGHCHPRVVEAASRQLAQLNIHSRYLNQGVMDYAQRLLATLTYRISPSPAQAARAMIWPCGWQIITRVAPASSSPRRPITATPHG
jgi:4-aminobutyrate aminotransferase-like enzyme